MKIQYCSDLHLEFPLNKEYLEHSSLVPVGDILVLAGDIVPIENIELADEFFSFCSDNFKETYWVAGNHEYYYGRLDDRIAGFREEIKTNVYLINNSIVEKEDFQLIFSTLWSRVSPEKAPYIQKGLYDYKVIREGDVAFSVDRCNQLFEENLRYLTMATENSNQKRNIVVTHHVPTYQNYPQEYLKSNLNEAFATDLDEFIVTANIHSWIFGHHHRNVPEFKVGSTRMLTNQVGYVKYAENKGFRRDAIVEL